ncbi:MAG TPA: hypothetical protein VGI96_42165 [Streptosporangiaceae bacterium]
MSHYVARLMERPGLDVTALAGQAGVPEAGLRAVLGGATPGQAQLRLLLHLAGHAVWLPPEQVRELRERVRLMPQHERPQPARPARPAMQPQRRPGGMLLRLRLFTNRNLEHSASYAIWAVSGRALSGSTPALAGHGRKELTREELADYISVLDISAADLSIVTGVDLPAS